LVAGDDAAPLPAAGAFAPAAERLEPLQIPHRTEGNSMIRAWIFLLALLTFPAALSAQGLSHGAPLNPTESAKVDHIVAEALASSEVPSASVALVRGGRIVFAKAYGTQSPSIRVARPGALYQIASISKQFTAAAILLLQDEHKLSLDDPVARYVPGITGGERVTIRQLLSHTSGLRDFWPQDYSFEAMSHPVTPRQIADRWAKAPLDFEPGTQWQYSNTGYVVAGMIVEKVSGEPLLQFLQERIFRPLDMHPIDQDLAVGAGFPAGYRRNALGPVRVETPAARGWLYAAGELAMSASDLARWDIARIDRKVLPAADWALQETPVKLNDGSSTGYGLGVFANERDGHLRVEHGGEAVGFLSENIVYPRDRIAIVVLVNAWFGRAQDEIAQKIEAMLLPPAGGGDRAVAQARTLYDQLRSGRLDRKLLTDNANFYFTPVVLDDYRSSLARLGPPSSFTANGPPRLRGGFVNRNYTLTFPGRKLLIVTYAEPGANGRWEQFLVMPAS
jgi:CubicO group peptidase (beta-lactamase class C family)